MTRPQEREISSQPPADQPRPTEAAVLAAAEAQLVEATALAWQWHGEQTRKGRTTSYMSHLSQVEGLVIDAGGGPTEAIAALLHDSLEDAPSPSERLAREQTIADRFGQAVLRIVLDLTDTQPDEAADSKGPWRERKERYLDQLRGAGQASLLVAACDKRQNLSDLVADLRYDGLATLDRFNAGASEQVWYFQALAAICRPAIPGRLAGELDHLVRAFEELTSA